MLTDHALYMQAYVKFKAFDANGHSGNKRYNVALKLSSVTPCQQEIAYATPYPFKAIPVLKMQFLWDKYDQIQVRFSALRNGVQPGRFSYS